MSSTILGTRLALLREKRGLSLVDVQTVIHAQTGALVTVEDLERAEYAPDDMPLERVAQIARAYDVALTTLLTGSGYDMQTYRDDDDDRMLAAWDENAERLEETLANTVRWLEISVTQFHRYRTVEMRRRTQLRAAAEFAEEEGGARAAP